MCACVCVFLFVSMFVLFRMCVVFVYLGVSVCVSIYMLVFESLFAYFYDRFFCDECMCLFMSVYF